MTTGVVATAERCADELLFPAALAADAADAVPVELLDALADAGLFGLAGPASAGGLDADFATVCAVVEALASGCLTTAFVWAQHLGAVIAAAQSDNERARSLPRPRHARKAAHRSRLAHPGRVPAASSSGELPRPAPARTRRARP